MTKFLAIDYGRVRCGLAVSDETNEIAFGRCVLYNNTNLLNSIAEIIHKEKIGSVVIGYPLSLSGKKTSQTAEVEDFKLRLQNYLRMKQMNVDIVLFDERLTSKIARASMIESGMKKNKRREKSELDIISATILLQDYLDSLN
jgi:putative Holliday junction resolvase